MKIIDTFAYIDRTEKLPRLGLEHLHPTYACSGGSSAIQTEKSIHPSVSRSEPSLSVAEHANTSLWTDPTRADSVRSPYSTSTCTHASYVLH